MTTAEEFKYRQLPMTENDFRLIARVAYQLTGIVLADHKKNMVYSRIVRRVRKLGLPDFRSYCQILENPDDEEINEFVNAITTNLTSFFRESHHFESLRQKVIPQLLTNPTKKVRIWSAGCSTGEEAYSIAIVLHEFFKNRREWDVKVLATDLDSNVLETGRQGVYERARVESLSQAQIEASFIIDKHQETVTVKDNIKQYIRFNRLNLLNEWPMQGHFDVIFCRNVVIYFDKVTQNKLFRRYADILNPQGYLFIGHSEQLGEAAALFSYQGKTEYRKK
ncbi:CheR family methyltransferase [Gynuella sunshinyii]|uniref:Chemotaxis protein methyltransferase n=1 Tax=Gynuella sunshinyii YC6258 TaxID=1445510 RepID=A0A0C5VNS9_9GAMM|nr:protein-glutamate O-methyltransferase [Gynuella sunshinyii]AJQ96327.1 methylase of chemotaxis methyl-accepting protein [Gynuella sunshinyii YC6258]